MSHTIDTATVRLQRELGKSEASIDTAIADVAAVLSTAARAQADLPDVAGKTGQEALLRLHKSLGSAIGLRADIMRAHGVLLEVAVETGVFERPDECPPSEGSNSAPLVAAA